MALRIFLILTLATLSACSTDSTDSASADDVAHTPDGGADLPDRPDAVVNDTDPPDTDASPSPDAAADTPPASVCGDGVLDDDEDCEDGQPVGVACTDVGFHRGWVGCSECHFDTSGCYAETCGDGVVQDGEACDDGNLDDGDACACNCTDPAAFNRMDREIAALMERYEIPGGVVAVTWQGRLVFARGYGTADEHGALPTDEAARFRIASLSKTVTSAAIHLLVERGELSTSDPVLPLVGPDELPEGLDPRWHDITIEHLLTHRGGFDPDDDPMFLNLDVADALGIDGPAEARDQLRYALGRPLDYTPGTRWVYSNLGFVLLGLVIESVTNTDYETWVRAELLSPMGVHRLVAGKSRPKDRPGDETWYHVTSDRSPSPSVFPEDERAIVRHPDGGFYVEGMTAMGGWTASAPDLARFLVHMDGLDTVPDVLSSDTIAAMTARPPDIGAWSDDVWYARGWYVQRLRDGGTLWSHQGVLSGTRAVMVREPNGLCWLGIFNLWPNGGDFSSDMVGALRNGARAPSSYPSHDLFGFYP